MGGDAEGRVEAREMGWQKAEGCDVHPESLDFVLETKESHGWVLKRGETGYRVEIGGRETN